MALTSPRFLTSNTLKKVEQNRAVLKAGSVGRPVHLVQMALLDLGYPMPISTAKPHHSPDGIFGEETKGVVKRFQQDTRTLTVDGVVGHNTLRELDRRFNRFQHRVRLHFRSIALTNVPFQTSMTNAETVYAQYGIKIEFASGMSLLLTPDQRELFNQIDQECDWEITDGELHQVQGLGPAVPSNEVLVFHVNTFADATTGGCGGHAPNRPACTVAASALAWDTAHEVCHVLLGSGFSPVHVSDLRNLMHPNSRRLASVPVLTSRQVAQIRSSVCCQPI